MSNLRLIQQCYCRVFCCYKFLLFLHSLIISRCLEDLETDLGLVSKVLVLGLDAKLLRCYKDNFRWDSVPLYYVI
jgi:hypothetical protein